MNGLIDEMDKYMKPIVVVRYPSAVTTMEVITWIFIQQIINSVLIVIHQN